MSIAKIAAAELPYLRRYARALTGSQTSGDRYVALLLEALIARPEAIDVDEFTKVSMFCAFSRLWNSLDVNTQQDTQPDLIADRRLGEITPKPRQAFLLTTMEGFSPSDVALILDVSSDEFDNLISQAGKEIAEQVHTRVLIIEDEPLIAMDLEALVMRLGHEVVGTARTRSEAVDLFNKTSPGLVLADIHLADGSSGIDAVNDMLSSIDLPVIFITAYPERLLTGEKPEPAFLINKPYDEAVVKAIISQVLFFDSKARIAA